LSVHTDRFAGTVRQSGIQNQNR